MDPNQRHTINLPNVVAEAFDDEIVVVNLSSGQYFGFAGLAARVWLQLSNGATTASVVEALTEAYPEAAIADDITAFAEALLGHELLTPTTDAAAESAQLSRIEAPAGAYAPPRIEVYSDLQDILLLDPIHEVDAAGWPTRADDSR